MLDVSEQSERWRLIDWFVGGCIISWTTDWSTIHISTCAYKLTRMIERKTTSESYKERETHIYAILDARSRAEISNIAMSTLTKP